MAKFEVTAPDGKKYEIDAPDQKTALDAFSRMQTQPQIKQSEAPVDNYDANLQKIRQTQFPNMSDEQFAQYSKQFLAPATIKDQAQGAGLFGLGDEIDAGVGALGSQVRQWTGGGGPGFGEAYGDYAKLNQSRRDVGAQQNGWAGNAADIVGSLTSLGPARAGVEAMVNGTAQAATKAPSLLKTVAMSAPTGAAMGALAGFGNADEDRAKAAAQGGLIGALVGGAAPVIGKAVSGSYRAVADALARGKAASSIGISPGAAAALQETMGIDNSLGPQGMARMNAAGNEAMLVDAGKSAQSMLDTAIQSSGRAGKVASEAIDARVGRDSQAITDALDGALGKPQGVETTRTQIRTDSAPSRGAAYDDAYAQPIDYSSEAGLHLDNLLKRVSQSDINAANELMRAEGHQSKQILAKIADDGTITYLRKPDVRQIDYITRALNDRAASNAGLGSLGGQTNAGRVYQNLSGDLRGAAKSAVPEYETALQTAADPIRRSNAVKFGSELMNPSTTRESVAEFTANLTGPEREALKQGIRSNISDKVANVVRSVSDGDVEARQAIKILRDMSSDAAREKISLAIGDSAESKALFDEIDRATKSFELRAGVADNSKTFARQNTNQIVGNYADSTGPISAVKKGEPVNAAKRLIQALTGETPANIATRKDKMFEEIARVLTSPGRTAAQNMTYLQGLQQSSGFNSDIAKALMNGFSASGAPLTLTTQNRN